MNAALAMIAGARPKDEIEGALTLLRVYVMQVEVLRRLRNGGQQFVYVHHVHVNDGGQAVIGNVKPASSICRSIDHGSGDQAGGGDADGGVAEE